MGIVPFYKSSTNHISRGSLCLFTPPTKDIMNRFYLMKQHINDELKKIPKQNRAKFLIDYINLIHIAQKDNYENFNLEG